MAASRRTDESFKLQLDKEHHLGISPLIKPGIGLVSFFPNDYMHNICLGVMRKLMNIWLDGPPRVKISKKISEIVSESLISFRNCTPCEFNRKPRSLSEFQDGRPLNSVPFLIIFRASYPQDNVQNSY